MAGGSLEAAWESAAVFLLRPLTAVAFVLSLIVLSWYVAWSVVLVHVPLVQEIAGMRRKNAAKPKAPNRGRFSKWYDSRSQRSARSSKSEETS